MSNLKIRPGEQELYQELEELHQLALTHQYDSLLKNHNTVDTRLHKVFPIETPSRKLYNPIKAQYDNWHQSLVTASSMFRNSQERREKLLAEAEQLKLKLKQRLDTLNTQTKPY